MHKREKEIGGKSAKPHRVIMVTAQGVFIWKIYKVLKWKDNDLLPNSKTRRMNLQIPKTLGGIYKIFILKFSITSFLEEKYSYLIKEKKKNSKSKVWI